MDNRWPIETRNTVYVKQDGKEWALRDCNGADLLKSESSLACFMRAAELEKPVARIQ